MNITHTLLRSAQDAAIGGTVLTLLTNLLPILMLLLINVIHVAMVFVLSLALRALWGLCKMIYRRVRLNAAPA